MKWERTSDDVVLHLVVHLITVLQVDASASHVVQHITINSRGMSRVDDDPALLTPLDRVILEQTSLAIRQHVKMETVFPFNAYRKVI